MHKVLVVDDDPKLCRIFSDTLKEAGYDVIIAYSAEDGLKVALETRPDIILSDYMLPDKNGRQFCVEVRNNKELVSTPFIVITGRGTQKLKTEGLSKLFDDYLEKPVDLSFLVAKVHATLRRRKQEFEHIKKKTIKFRSIVTAAMLMFFISGGLALGYKMRLNMQHKELINLKTLKAKYDNRIIEIENQLDSLGWELDDLDFQRLNKELNQLIRKAKIISKELPEEKERDIIIRGIKKIMAEFGEENYIVPPLFAKEVARMVDYYVGPKRYHMQKNLERSEKYLPMSKKIFTEKGLPEILAFIAMVESGFDPDAVNPKSGAAGLWQLMPATAREYGLRVNKRIDERKDPIKSTISASEFILDLIGIFGKDSVLLALASYNVGDGVVRYQLKKLYNPLEDRDFWYLFRKRALPQETREYIPKIIASIIIHENAEHYGFKVNRNVIEKDQRVALVEPINQD